MRPDPPPVSVTWKWLGATSLALLVTVGGVWEGKQDNRLAALEHGAVAHSEQGLIAQADIKADLLVIRAALEEISRKLEKLEHVADQVKMQGYHLPAAPPPPRRPLRYSESP